MFSKLFKPKWQHADSQVRLTALQQLKLTELADVDIIRTLTSDPDSTVRLAAIDKLPPSFESLDRLAAIETDRIILNRIRARLTDLMVQSPAAETLARITSDTDNSLLETLLKKSPHRLVREHVLAMITKESMLEYVVIHDPDSELKAIALQRIDSLPSFERIIKQFRTRNKEMTRLAKERLKFLEDELARPIETERQARQICTQLEGAVAGGYVPRLAADLELAQAQWKLLETTPPPELTERYQTVFAIILEVLAQHEQEEAQRHALEQQYDAVKAEKTRLLTEAKELVALVRAQPDWYRTYSLTELDSTWAALVAAWNASGDLPTRDGASLRAEWERVQEDIIQAQRTLNSFPKTLSQIERTGHQIDKMMSSFGVIPDDKHREVKQRVASIRLPEAVDRLEQIEILYEQLKKLDELAEARQQKAKTVASELPALIQSLEKLLGENDLAASQTLSKRVRQRIDFLPEKRHADWRSQFNRQLARIKELEDWRGFATQPKREELCVRMEKLIDAEMPADLRAQSIKELQEEWKALGGGDPREVQTLWERFHKAAEQAYLPCKAHYEEQARVRQEHLARREAICDQLADQLTWLESNTPDWELLDKFIQTAYNEWRDCGTVDRRYMSQVGQRFHDLINALKAIMQAHYKQNREQKELLITQLKEALKSAEPWEATELAKKAQQQWRTIGPAGFKSERPLWTAFRKVCDQIFERRQQAYNEQKVQADTTLSAQRDLLNQFEQELNAPDFTKASIELALLSFNTAWDTLWDATAGQESSDQQHPLVGRLRKLTALAEQKLNHLRSEVERNRITVDERKAALCVEYETLLLASGSLSLEQIEGLKIAWETAGAGTKEIEAILEPRYQRLIGAAELSADELTALAKQGEAQLTLLESICLDMEILADVPSPKGLGLEAERMRRKVARLEGRLRHGTHPDQDELRTLEAQWYAASMVPAKAAQPLNARFARARAALLGG